MGSGVIAEFRISMYAKGFPEIRPWPQTTQTTQTMARAYIRENKQSFRQAGLTSSLKVHYRPATPEEFGRREGNAGDGA